MYNIWFKRNYFHHYFRQSAFEIRPPLVDRQQREPLHVSSHYPSKYNHDEYHEMPNAIIPYEQLLIIGPGVD